MADSMIKPIFTAYIWERFTLSNERAPNAAPLTEITAVEMPTKGKMDIFPTRHPVVYIATPSVFSDVANTRITFITIVDSEWKCEISRPANLP